LENCKRARIYRKKCAAERKDFFPPVKSPFLLIEFRAKKILETAEKTSMMMVTGLGGSVFRSPGSLTMKKFGSLGLILILAGTAGWAQQPEKDDGKFFFFKDGDTIVVMGDSITEQHLYSNYLEMWSVCRFPKRKLTFRNVGIGGDRSTGGNNRFKRDVLPYKATVLTVDFGMNDGNYKPFNEQAFKTYMKGLQGIADQAKAAKIRVAWITPQPVEERKEGPAYKGYNETLEKFSEGVGQIAAKNHGMYVDQFNPYLAILARARATDPKNINVTGGDRVHPGPAGQIVMAAAILKRLDFQRLVSRVVIDIDPDKGYWEATVQTENCEAKIAGTRKDDSALIFTRLDFALPFFPADAKSILKWSPILNEMNRYLLKIKGLKAGKYAVEIGGKKIAEYSDKELAKGVNLAGPALVAGPIADQVNKVWKAVRDKNQYFHDQIFRGVVLAGPKSPIFKDVDPKDREAKRQEIYAERMKKMPELDAAVRKTLEMKAHTFHIVPVKIEN
jgi:lysophospholipase L1-like esterase